MRRDIVLSGWGLLALFCVFIGLAVGAILRFEIAYQLGRLKRRLGILAFELCTFCGFHGYRLIRWLRKIADRRMH